MDGSIILFALMPRTCQKVLPSHDIKILGAPVGSESGALVGNEKRISKIEVGNYVFTVLLHQTSENQAKTNSCVKVVRISGDLNFVVITSINLVCANLTIIGTFINNFSRLLIKIFKKQLR